MSCCWYHKGTNFQANHNICWSCTRQSCVVADTTKVRIFKQITTLLGCVFASLLLLLIPQRYEFSSKSQLDTREAVRYFCCCWYHKGTNFQANHNPWAFLIIIGLLLLIPQRYEFSSKSQPFQADKFGFLSCCWYHKGTNFQANHNSMTLSLLILRVVADTTKVRIFKQITTSS